MVSRPGTSGHLIVQIQRRRDPVGASEYALVPAQGPSAEVAFARRASARRRSAQPCLNRRLRGPRPRRVALSRRGSRQASAEDQRLHHRDRSGPASLRRRPSGPATEELTTRRREESGRPLVRQACLSRRCRSRAQLAPSVQRLAQRAQLARSVQRLAQLAPQAWLRAQLRPLRALQATSRQYWSSRRTTGQRRAQGHRTRAAVRPGPPGRQSALRRARAAHSPAA